MPVIEFADAPAPVCSIVILAWRLTDVLLDCLTSIAASVDAPSYEVVIVLNGATDDVRQTVAENVRGARIVDLEYNVGFGGGCNAGAFVARGEYLVFLNDDTVVDPHWLGLLYGAAVGRPGIGGVASLLLNVDGSVQESGSRVLSDAVTVQFGRGLSLAEAQAAGLLQQRPIDYGSAAALLVPTAAFRQLSGFDPAYEPAYFEDVDLQLRLKSAGLEVIIEPSARVTHLSGASTSSTHAFRDWAYAHSLPFFQSRWAAVLETAPDEDAPLDELCLVAADPAKVNHGRPLSTADEIAAGSVVTALVIARGFGTWAGARYGAAIADYQRVEKLYYDTEALYAGQVAELNRHLTAHVNRVAELEAELARLGAENTLVHARLNDLNTRGPLGLAKWQAGLVVAKRNHSRS